MLVACSSVGPPADKKHYNLRSNPYNITVTPSFKIELP